MKRIPVLLLLLSGNFLFAQHFDVTVSGIMKLDGPVPVKVGEQYYGLDTDAKSQFGYTFKLNKIKYAANLQKYDASLKLISEVKLSNGERVYGPFRPQLKRINDQLFFIYYQLSDEKDDIQLLISEVDLSDLSLKAPVELMRIEQKNYGLMQAGDVLNHYQLIFAVSPDKNKLLALWHSGAGNQVFFTVRGAALEKIRSATEIAKKETKIQVNNACIDNGGNVYISYNNSKQEAGRVLVSRATGKSTELDIRISGGTVYEAFVMAASDQHVNVTGVYRENSGNLTGVFAQSLNATDFKLNTAEKIPFPKWMIQQFAEDGWASEKGKDYGLGSSLGMRPYSLEDGSVHLVGEFRKMVSTTRNSYMVVGGIVDVHFKKDGVAFSRIPRERVSAGSDIGDSFTAVPYREQIVIFYNDHSSNIKRDITKSATRSDNYKNSVLVAATMSTDGTVKRDILIDLSSEDYLPVAENLQIVDPASVLIPIRKIKGLGKVDDDFKWGLIRMN